MAAPIAISEETVPVEDTIDLINTDQDTDFSSDDYDQDLEDELNDFDGWDNATGGTLLQVVSPPPSSIES